MQNAPALNDASATFSATSLDPYGQLVKMLLPRAQSIVIYDRMGVAMWVSEGLDDSALHQLVQEALAREMAEPGREEGFAEDLGSELVAYVFMLRDRSNALLASVGVLSRESAQPRGLRPFATVQGMLRPALECLERELVSQYSIGEMQRSLVVRDQDLELLLGTAQDDGDDGDSTDDFAKLVQGCVDHLGCSVGALLIPDKNIAVCRTGNGTPPRVGASLLTNTHRHIIGWTQLHRQTMTANHPFTSGPLAGQPYKILACPVMHGAQQVLGTLVLYKPPGAPDFDLRQVRIVELLARRVVHILLNAYDPSTGLLTRTAFEKRVTAALTPQALQDNNSVIYVDIDRLHLLNESLGMHVGDAIIVKVADAIRNSLSPRMLAARISGDRYAIFVPEVRVDRVQDIAERLRAKFETLGTFDADRAVEVTASIGIARICDGRQPLSHALAAAEIACKAAKDRGRNRVELYEDSDQSIVRRYTDIAMVSTLRSALLESRFRLEAQTIVPLNGATAAPKYELLLRMTDEAGAIISPEKFLTTAERYQLAPAIDRWVVRHVIDTLQAVAALLAAKGACFAVNISGQSLGDQEFASFLDEALRSSGLPMSLLSWEVTETAAVANIVRAEVLIRRLRHLGCDVALDDFGRGLSSLTYLKVLPVTHLKIDGTFVRDVVGDDRSQAMLSAIVQLARAMGLRTVAECVESDEIGATVARLGVECGQGFSIGRPIPLDRVLKALVGANIPGRSPQTA
jgi:diguanylate cyclase (GGDEF)-like protein